jgi:hypothetical protein
MDDERRWFHARIRHEPACCELDIEFSFTRNSVWAIHRHERDYWREKVLSVEEVASGESPG